MSSLKMTFSLTSLILIIALGLVFVPTSVEAHWNATGSVLVHSDDSTAANYKGHADLNADVADDPATTNIIEAATAHNSHPKVTKVTLKGANTRNADMKAAVTDPSAIGGSATDNQFTLVIKFDQPVAKTAAVPSVPAADEGALLSDANFNKALLGTDGNAAAAASDGTAATVTFRDATRSGTTKDTLEVVVAIGAAWPTGTANATDEEFTLKFEISEGVVYSLQTRPNVDTVPGGRNLLSDAYTVTLVKELGDGPTPTTGTEGKITGEVSFDNPFPITITFAKADVELTEGDILVTGGARLSPNSLYEDTPAADEDDMTVYKAAVEPFTNAAQVFGVITITLKTTDKVKPAAADMGGVLMARADGDLVSITVPDGTIGDGPFVVTLTFATSLADSVNVMATDLMVTPADNPDTTAKEPAAVIGDINPVPLSMRKEWTVEITPVSGTDTVIKLSDMGKEKFGGSDAMVTVPATASPGPAGTVIESVDFTSYDKTTGMVALTETTPLGVNGFGVVQTHNPMLPNIWRFFAETGTINVLVADKADGTAGGTASDLVISEIMWGLDLRLAGDAAAANQFIELYNTTATPIDLTKVSLYFDARDVITAADDAAVSGYTILDQVSNAKGVGWSISNAPGQSGRVARPDDVTTFVAQNLVSMYLDITYATVEKGDHDADATKNREAQLKGVPDGSDLSKWKASNEVAERYDTNLVGSPGKQHFSPVDPLIATTVPYSPFIINEIGNYSGDANDWVEIRNVSTTDRANLRNYKLSQVKEADKTDTALVTIEDKDQWVGPGEVALIVNTDPHLNASHPVVAGIHMNSTSTRLLTTGLGDKNDLGPRYYVDSGLKLADSGKTLLILRNNNSNDHLGKAAHIIDLVGSAQITDSSSNLRTELWPLVGHGKPGDNVFKDIDEDFRAGRVYHRNKDKAGTADETITLAGNKGDLGYKRGHSGNGSPGYPDSAIKDNETDLSATGGISISEIMYAKNRTEPQWIELYNSSLTQAVNLNDWKLRIDHSADETMIDIRSRSVTTNVFGGNIIIQPNQTVLIVSTTTNRNSSQPRGRSDFPATRLIDLWAQKDKLEVPASGKTRLTYRLLSETAFKLVLIDKTGATVDTVGNLGATSAWDLPSSPEDNGEGRSSIIRRYDDGVPRDGTMEDSWVFSRDSHLDWARLNETYYGAPDDIGTPGFRAGGPLPVSLSKFRPERLKDTGEVVVRWITESELNNAGFNILRSEKRNGEFTKVHYQAGQGTTSERTVYEWKDKSAKPNVVYYYQIQDVSLDGKVTPLRITHLRGNVTAAGKLTTTWAGLKALQ